ncbi:MAG: response regulator [Chloroflexi bacterium]|nr:response regulator [Chloroflexota bacterium]
MDKERILLVESNPDISDFITRQALKPFGYNVNTVNDASTAIRQAIQFAPDVIVSNLELPGLSGKDLLVALTSQGQTAPLIVIAEKGQENSILQAFRLGASDYLPWPVREAEVVSAVERALKQVRERREREKLDRQLKQTNEELQQRVRELTTIFGIGKAVLSITDQRALMDKIVEGAAYVSGADFGWLLLRDEKSRNFLLAAQRNLPEAWAKKIGHPLDDGISSLVALSGETLAIHGEPLKRFKVASLGQAAVVAPVKVQQEVIGLLVVVRKENRELDHNVQTLLTTVADYASVSLVHARLFRALQESVEAAQNGERRKNELIHALRSEIKSLLQPVTYPVELMLGGKMGGLSDGQQEALQAVQAALKRGLQVVTSDRPSQPLHSGTGE